ncbi:hypothetical protein [Alloactinosynnema sp. L-07]|nr:hypothetical protein [Alloactinosynnema sp. L-07]
MGPHRVVEHHRVLAYQRGLHPAQHEAVCLNLRLRSRC